MLCAIFSTFFGGFGERPTQSIILRSCRRARAHVRRGEPRRSHCDRRAGARHEHCVGPRSARARPRAKTVGRSGLSSTATTRCLLTCRTLCQPSSNVSKRDRSQRPPTRRPNCQPSRIRTGRRCHGDRATLILLRRDCRLGTCRQCRPIGPHKVAGRNQIIPVPGAS